MLKDAFDMPAIINNKGAQVFTAFFLVCWQEQQDGEGVSWSRARFALVRWKGIDFIVRRGGRCLRVELKACGTPQGHPR